MFKTQKLPEKLLLLLLLLVWFFPLVLRGQF
jgi:hypothetical protein